MVAVVKRFFKGNERTSTVINYLAIYRCFYSLKEAFPDRAVGTNRPTEKSKQISLRPKTLRPGKKTPKTRTTKKTIDLVLNQAGTPFRFELPASLLAAAAADVRSPQCFLIQGCEAT